MTQASWFAVNERHQRLEHALGRLAQRVGRLKANALRVGIVSIAVDGEGDAGLLQYFGRARRPRHHNLGWENTARS